MDWESIAGHPAVPHNSHSTTGTYSPQFTDSSYDILSRLKLANSAQHNIPHKDADTATLSLPGQVPDWTPVTSEEKTPADGKAASVDFGQDTVQLRMPGYDAETEIRRQKFADSIANLEQPSRLDLLGFTAGHASNTAVCFSRGRRHCIKNLKLTGTALRILFSTIQSRLA